MKRNVLKAKNIRLGANSFRLVISRRIVRPLRHSNSRYLTQKNDVLRILTPYTLLIQSGVRIVSTTWPLLFAQG